MTLKQRRQRTRAMIKRTVADSMDAAYLVARIGSKLQALTEIVHDERVRTFWMEIADDTDWGIARVLPQAKVIGGGKNE